MIRLNNEYADSNQDNDLSSITNLASFFLLRKKRPNDRSGLKHEIEKS